MSENGGFSLSGSHVMKLKSGLESFRVIYLNKYLCALYVLCSMVQFKDVPNNLKFCSVTKKCREFWEGPGS